MERQSEQAPLPFEMTLDNFKLCFIEALKDSTVISQLKTAIAVSDQVAEHVAAKLDVRFKVLQDNIRRKDEEINSFLRKWNP